MTEIDRDEEGSGGSLIANLPDILWQRKKLVILPTVAALLAGTAAAVLMKPVYTSKATILIESQQLPETIVGSSANDMIDQRIARIRQRVLSRPDLVKIIRANGLYPKDQTSRPLSAIVEEMRKATTIEAIGADIAGGQGGKSTIAFQIGFDYSDPVKAQRVAQQYVNNFLALDASVQAEQAVGAASFLNEQAQQIQTQIRAVEEQITQIKTQNGSLLAMQAASTGNPIADSAQLDSQIAQIESENARIAMGGLSGPSPQAANVQQIEAALSAAQAKFSDSHPDVLQLKAQLAAAKAAAKDAPNMDQAERSLIARNNQRIASLRAAKGMILSQGAVAAGAQARAPAVAEQVAQLESKAEGLRDQYNGIAAKLVNAQVSARMETEQKGERLTLADPPVVPEEPVKPNRPLILGGALVFGLGLGVGLVLLLELLFKPIRGTKSLFAAAGRPPLVVIPELDKKPGFLLNYLQNRSRKKLDRARARTA